MGSKEFSATDKRIAVWILKRKGKTQAEIAAILSCSVRTVRRYWNLRPNVSKEYLAKQVDLCGHF